MDSDLYVFPRGISHKGLEVEGENSLDWISKYGSVTTSVYGLGSSDGVNEKGLGAHALWLAESDYGARDRSLPGLSISLWPQFFLDNFATTAEAVEYVQEHPFQIVTMPFSSSGKPATAHLKIEDAAGYSAVFEYVKGKLNIYHSSEFRVMTNSPSFSEQLENLKKYEGFGGSDPLPGTTKAADRFVRAAYYLRHLREPHTVQESIAGIISVVRNVSQPFLAPSPTEPNTSSTLWRTVIDHTNKVYYFESTLSPNIVWLDLKRLNSSENAEIKKTFGFRLAGPYRRVFSLSYRYHSPCVGYAEHSVKPSAFGSGTIAT